MIMKKSLLTTCFLLLAIAASAATEWQRLSAKLMTPWGETIDPENVWQEYPRPQLVRGAWINLNGPWEYFRRSNSVRMTYENNKNNFKKTILVPFGVESALSGIMETDYSSVANSTLMYRRTFTLTNEFQGKRTLLHFGAVDWRCVVWVNGTEVGTHQGGSDPFTFDITEALTNDGEQELQVAVYDPSSRGGQPTGKQTISPSSIWYTSCSGIWQTVWLEAVNAAHIERYEVVPDATTGTARIKVIATDPTCKFKLTAFDGETAVASSEETSVGEEVTLTIPDAKLWTPDTPFIYDLDITLIGADTEECDHVKGYFGLRTLSKGTVDGHPAFLLNGKPIFMIGPLDQGWWPDGLLTPPSYEAMIYDLKTIKSLGMNMVRKHIKVENDLWYEWCDRNGLIVWQDMPSGGSSGSIGSKEEIQQNFYDECLHIVTALKQHPSIGVWVPYNEGWGQDANAGPNHTIRGYLVVRNADADHGRLMNAASGWTDFEIGDIADAHSYPSPNGHSNSRNDRINVCGEYGGITLMIEGHLWAGSQQTYTQVSNSDDYTERFNQYTFALQALQYTKGLWAGVYTQITDVEQEVNGILTYDRKVLKINDEQLASIRAKIEQTINNRMANAKSVVSAGDNSENISWRYTTSEPEEDWMMPEFSDSRWKRGIAGFGDISQPDARVRTSWSSPEIWIRRHFRFTNVKEENLPDICLRMFHDEDTEVYINGVLAVTVTGYNTTYQLFELSEAARKAIDLSGENTIAIHTLQTSGGQYIDAGFSLKSFKSNETLVVKPIEANVPTMQEDPKQAYLLCYTKNDDDHMYYSYSLDGLTWQSLKGGQSVFGVEDGQPDVQGPFLYRMEDEQGKTRFHLIHGLPNAKGLYHWTSQDLLTWEPVNGTDGKVLDAKVLSPEIGFDPVSQYWIYYWTNLSDGQYVPLYTRTQDFVNFSKVVSYFTAGSSAIDLHVFKDGEEYVALFTDPDNRGLCTAHSKNLNPSQSKFSNVKKVFNNNLKLKASSTIPSFSGDGWLMMGALDGEFYLASTGFAEAKKLSWSLYEYGSCAVPEDMNMGKVLVITRSELSQLLMTLDGIDTGVQPLTLIRPAQAADDAVYNLQGLRISRPLGSTALPHGIYVTQGRKILIK